MMHCYRKIGLNNKLSLFIILIILTSFGVVGVYFDSFLKESHFQNTKKKMHNAYNRMEINLSGAEDKLKKWASFIQEDEYLLASVALIDNYQDKQNYNASLLDEEKKYIASQLLSRVKLSLNNDIALYDKNEELISFVVKKDEKYNQNFVSYENGEPVLYCKYEDEKLYTTEACAYSQFLTYKHPILYKNILPKEPIITYHSAQNNLYLKSHLNIFLSQSKEVMGHVEMTHLIGKTYFENLSDDLEIKMSISSDEKYSKVANQLLDKELHDSLIVTQTDREYVGAMRMDTRDSIVYLVASLEKDILNSELSTNRMKLIMILFVLGSVFLFFLYLFFRKNLAQPLEVIMNQINKIEMRDYSRSQHLTSDDELEAISKNINNLASTIKERELALHTSQSNLQYLSTHDPLTDLPNRRFFTDRLEHAIKIAERTHSKMAIIFLDLDEFKEVNDSLGHDIGDELLKEVSNRLTLSLRSTDTLSRIGGDEFYILLENVKSHADIESIVQKIYDEFQTPFACKEYSIETTASMGIAIYPENGVDSVSLIKNSDLAMYQSKNRGRNHFSFFYEELSDQMRERMRWIIALKDAVHSCSEFTLMYQPKISSVSGKIVAVESLVRWNSSVLGFAGPDKFIRLAEETKLIVPLGKWIIEKACQDFLGLLKEGYNLSHVFINISSVQLLHSDMIQTLKDTLDKIEIKPEQIELEITESYIATDEKRALQTLQSFRDMGIKLAVDDFGTGYSSLSYLQKLPVTRLKIDKSFVDNLPNSKDSVSIVKVIIALAKTFNLSLTAEGVETKEQLDFLTTMECDEIQGYYYSKPLSLDDLKSFCKS